MTDTTEYVIIGKVGAPYGIKGWVKITSFTMPIANVLSYDPWYIQEGQAWQPTKITGGREHGKGIVAKLAGLENPEQARLWTGKEIAIKRSQLPVLEKHEYYWSDLAGLTVINQTGDVLGKVIYLMETGSNDVLVIKGDKEYGIPYLFGEVIIDVDLTKKVMHVKWDLI
jgi:16S rRNA processing protein RimM